MNKLILAFLVIIILLVAGLSLYFAPSQSQTTNQSTVQNGIKTNSQTEHPVISGQDAKLISINLITESGAYPGNPTLYKMSSDN
ncbi:MAG: hypothetical protein LLF83_00280 [Methanobacterium sp.]|nr:hypothetical protein [Methanobacterium sp.]